MLDRDRIAGNHDVICCSRVAVELWPSDAVE
jgi:hypothetical protein